MNKPIPRSLIFNAIINLTLSASGGVPVTTPVGVAGQEEFPQVTTQPVDQDVTVGSSTTLTVGSTNADGFQWVRNGVVLDGQTNSTLTISQVGINDTGLYSCFVFKGSEAVPTREATLNVVAMASAGGPITVFGTPVLSNGQQGSCPGHYIGYVNFRKTAADGWGWAPTAGTTIHTASDGSGRADTKIQYGGKYGDNSCDLTTIGVPQPPFSPLYRFTIFFTNNVPTNAYPIVLNGFDP
jgi:hypothetical protein